MPRRVAVALLPAVGVLAITSAGLAGCDSSSSDTTGPAAGASAPARPLSGRINVLAAASLTEAFGTLGTRFEEAHPDTEVVFSFGPSSSLATQIVQGAPADVFASASTTNMGQVADANAADEPTTFVTNAMAIAVPPDNPADIGTLRDLAGPGVKVAVCQPKVPCGAVADEVFDNAGVDVVPVTEETDVKATLTKVQLGEVDAGIVYVTDILAAGDKVQGIDIPADLNASTSYPIATLTDSEEPALARAFVDYVLSDRGLAVLTDAGFRQP